MPDDRRHIRIYYSIIDDAKFDDIRGDDHHFSTWVRLLMAADSVWPASADLPATARKSSIAALEAAGIIDLMKGSRFRIHGLDAERERRSAQPTQAARTRWQNADALRSDSGRTALAGTPAMRTEHSNSRAEEEHSNSGNGYPTDDARDSQDRYYELTLYRPWGIWSGDALLAAERDYGRAETIAALDLEWSVSSVKKTILSRVQARLARDADAIRQSRKVKPRPARPDPEAAYVESQRLQAELIAGITAVKDVL